MGRTFRPVFAFALALAASGTFGLAENIDPENDGSQYARGENSAWINAAGRDAGCFRSWPPWPSWGAARSPATSNRRGLGKHHLGGHVPLGELHRTGAAAGLRRPGPPE